MCNEHMQGDEWGTYVALGRSAPPERGMAYGARALGSRSPRSSSRWGKPITWRRGTGRRHVKGEGCEMHTSLNQVDAAHWRAALDRKTHEPFGGGPLEKYPQGQLAGGLPYRMRGFGAEVDRAICPSTVTNSDPFRKSMDKHSIYPLPWRSLACSVYLASLRIRER